MSDEFARLEALVRTRMDETRTPGLAAAFFNRTETVHIATYGYADLDAQLPVTPQTLFEIGSITKSFTALAVMQAVEAGLLDLQRPITDYLPWFRVQTQYEMPTLHHLLTHTAGLMGVIDRAPDIRGAVWALRETETAWAPGERFEYSDAGYQILTLILEKIHNRPFAQIIDDNIFAPLGMTASVAAITHAIRPRLARGYVSLYDDRPGRRSDPLVPATWIETNSGDCCIASTAEDMAAYARMLLNQGQGPNGRLLSPQGFTQLLGPHASADWCVYGYGLMHHQHTPSRSFEQTGAQITSPSARETGIQSTSPSARETGVEKPIPHIGHGGGMVGYTAEIMADLEHGVGMAVLCNGPYPPGLFWKMLDCWRQIHLGRTLDELDLSFPDPTVVEDGAPYVGRYRCDEQTLTITSQPIGPDQEWLILQHGETRVLLEARDDARFYVDHPDFDRYLLGFERNGDGAAEALYYGPDWYAKEPDPTVRTRHVVSGSTPDNPSAGTPDVVSESTASQIPDQWRAYPGHYRSHNPWLTNFRVILRRDKLLLVWAGGSEDLLVPCGEDTFRVGDQPTPERISFDQIADGQALRATYAACDYYRFFAP